MHRLRFYCCISSFVLCTAATSQPLGRRALLASFGAAAATSFLPVSEANAKFARSLEFEAKLKANGGSVTLVPGAKQIMDFETSKASDFYDMKKIKSVTGEKPQQQRSTSRPLAPSTQMPQPSATR